MCYNVCEEGNYADFRDPNRNLFVYGKQHIYDGKYEFRNRDRELLDQMLIAFQTALDIILDLSYRDYVKGPEQDRNIAEQHIYLFGSFYENTEFYIKFLLEKRMIYMF